MRAQIVLGLQFGDEGKGRTVDHLCNTNFGSSIVVRFSGGQQAGHTTFHNDIKHIHSSYGSGALRGIPTYISEHCTVLLDALANEGEVLKQKIGLLPPMYVHPLAKLTTPYDIAYNRVTELKNNHGSCGMGVGATMKRHDSTGYKLYVNDLRYPAIMFAKLEKIKNYYFDKLEHFDDKKTFLAECILIESKFKNMIFNYVKYFKIADYGLIHTYNNVIFEGSQGIMLDMDHGVFPNVTYANTTSKNALEIINKLNKYQDKINTPLIPEVFYVTRCYQTRHGEGWMSNNDPIKLINNEEEINQLNPYQGQFKVAELDYALLNYALQTDGIYSKYGDKNLVVTCLDQRPGFNFDYGSLDITFNSILNAFSPKDGLQKQNNKKVVIQ